MRPSGRTRGLAVATDGRGVAAGRDVRGEHRGRSRAPRRGRRGRVCVRAFGVDADRVGVVARVDLDERAGVDRPLAVVPMPIMTFGVHLADAEERVGRLAVLPGDGDHLRPVRVRGEELHVVRAAEVLPARVAELAVVAREEARRSARGSAGRGDGRRRRRSTVIVASCETTRECSYSSARVPIAVYISFVDERDDAARHVDRVDVVVVAGRLLVDARTLPSAPGVRAAPCRCGSGRSGPSSSRRRPASRRTTGRRR